jgi:hypothetical protein
MFDRARRHDLGEDSSQDRRFARRVHKGEFVRESLTLSLNDSAIFFRFCRMIDDFDRLPYRNMPALAGAEDPVQHAAYGA